MAKATKDSSNTSTLPQLTAAELTALCGHLRAHAEKLESIIARPLVEDLLLASRAIEQLLRQQSAAETLFVKVEEIDGDKVTLINERIAFDEVIGDDDVEKADALMELRRGGVTRIGGGSAPLYRLTKVGR